MQNTAVSATMPYQPCTIQAHSLQKLALCFAQHSVDADNELSGQGLEQCSLTHVKIFGSQRKLALQPSETRPENQKIAFADPR